MKKNRMMRLASILLVCVLLTTSVISGTFAKYVTEKSYDVEARVAKWGVEINVTNAKMFSDSYKNAATTYTVNEQTGDITVQADTANTNVIAPGTSGSLTGIAITGCPEVDVEVIYDANLVLTGWTVDGDDYCPIEITVGDETFKIGTGADDPQTVAELEAKVEEAIEAKGTVYHTNTDLSVVNDDVQVSWVWPFEVDNYKDTKLANELGNLSSIKLTVKTTIAQVN